MRSSHAECFNHDEDAAEYDADVEDETQPLRAGYAALLDWIIEAAAIGPGSRVLELGSGTGNLTRRVRDCAEIVCVDISGRMEAIARTKLAHLPQRRFAAADLLEYFDADRGGFDIVLSSFAIHHLTEDEKQILFRRIDAELRPGARAVFGDLMLTDGAQREREIEFCEQRGDTDTAAALREEFFWHLDDAERALRALGLEVEHRRFSRYVHGVCAVRP